MRVSKSPDPQSNQASHSRQSTSDNTFVIPAASWGSWIPTLFDPRQFFTLTSRDPVFEDTMCRRYGKIVLEVNREVFGNNFRRHGLGLSHVYAIEPQRRGVPHIHAVWDAEYVPYDLVHRVAKRISGWAWIEPVTSDCGVGHYVTKYAVKGGRVSVYLSRKILALQDKRGHG